MSDLAFILLAEDNADDAALTLKALSKCDLANRLVHVKDGVEAMDYLRRRGAYADRAPGLPAVLLLDIKMPRRDGFEVLREIRDDADLRPLPVVMFTSSRQEEDVVASYKLGVNAYVVKPVDFERFADAVKQLGVFWAVLNERPPETA